MPVRAQTREGCSPHVPSGLWELGGGAGPGLQRPRAHIVVLVVVAEVEPGAQRHPPHVGRRDDVAVVLRDGGDDDDLRLEER